MIMHYHSFSVLVILHVFSIILQISLDVGYYYIPRNKFVLVQPQLDTSKCEKLYVVIKLMRDSCSSTSQFHLQYFNWMVNY